MTKSLNIFNFLGEKLQFTIQQLHPQAFIKDAQAMQEKPSAFKREHPALQHMKFLYFFYFRVIFILLDPDPATPTIRIRIRNPAINILKLCMYRNSCPETPKHIPYMMYFTSFCVYSNSTRPINFVSVVFTPPPTSVFGSQSYLSYLYS